MNRSRLELHAKLVELLGSNYVYFQPPASVQMHYPAIVYSLAKIDDLPANNVVYQQKVAYQVTLIDKNPDSSFIKALSVFPFCKFDRTYQSDNLNHYVFTLFY